jgi:uncharacterized protein YjbI with pentapeptide repeats
MKFEIKNRWTGNVQYSCELDAEFAGKSVSIQLGAAVKMGYKSGAVLRDADLSDAVLRDADLSDAVLRGADLRGADLSGAVLSGADLRDAVLRGAVLRGAVLRGADLRGAVLSGADLRDAVLSGADLRGADLRGADLSGAVLSGADLRDAVLRGAVLSGAVLSGADLRDAVLSDAVLSGADLSGADLRGAVLRGGLEGIPKIKDIHQAVYAAASKKNALDMGSWHACKTTHCRGGWIVALAGDAGKALEWALGTPAAAALIYIKSDPKLEKIPDFYATNEDALDDMKSLAELEAVRVAHGSAPQGEETK